MALTAKALAMMLKLLLKHAGGALRSLKSADPALKALVYEPFGQAV